MYYSKCGTCGHANICSKKELFQNVEKEVGLLRNNATIENNKVNFKATTIRMKYDDDLQKKYKIRLAPECEDYSQDLRMLNRR